MSQPQHRCLLRPVGSEVEFSSPPFPPLTGGKGRKQRKGRAKKGGGLFSLLFLRRRLPRWGRHALEEGGKRLLNGWLEGRARMCLHGCVGGAKKIETGMRDLDTLDTKGTRLITRAGTKVQRHYWSKSLVTKFVHSACAFNSLVN